MSLELSNLNWLYRGTSEIFPNQPESLNPDENLAQRLASSRHPLRVKLGIDPTGADIHLGHSIPFRKLRAFQDAGHTAVAIIGDFTAQIGDPGGKSEVRRQLTPQQVRDNAKNYLEQLRPILDFETPGRLEIRYNSEWLSKLDLAKILELLATTTVGQMLAKEGFAERYAQETPIYLHEFLYPLMQGYDSVAVEADVELGGTDQKFNIAVGRDLQRHFGQSPQFGLLLPILLGTDGSKKMSKSLNNYVGLKEDPLSMYSKLEKTPDVLLKDYFELLTNLPLDQLPDNPREGQKLLAREIVSHYYGNKAALASQKAAEQLVMGGNAAAADAVPEYALADVEFPARLFYLLSASGLCPSSGEGRRQIQGGAVRLNSDRITDPNCGFASPEELYGKVLQVGKKKIRAARPMNPADRIIVPLDVPSLDEATALIDRLPLVSFWKVGLELFVSVGPAILALLKEKQKRIFLDLKLHDIPNTVAGACRSAAAYEVDLLTLHATAGRQALQAAAAAVRTQEQSTRLLAITLLTSLNSRELAFDLKIPLELTDYALQMALLAQEAGLDGAVCSPHEAEQLRQVCGNRFLLVCPGVRPDWSPVGDQRRVMTPAQALRAGADYLVIGRPITGAPDPEEAWERTCQELTAV